MRSSKVSFSRQFKRVYYEFTGEKTSSDGGVLLLDKIEKKHRILRDFSSAIPDYRSPLLVEHTIEKMLKQRVYLMALGYEDCDDSDVLRNDPVISMFMDKTLASQPTLRSFNDERHPRCAMQHRCTIIGRLPGRSAEGTNDPIANPEPPGHQTHAVRNRLDLLYGTV